MRRKLRGETPDLPEPDLLVGAGHRTHLPVLVTRIVCGGRTVVLMRPTLPGRWFDLLFVPEHDRIRRKANVVETRGVLCPAVAGDRQRHTGLILLGGTSPHFHWSNRDVCHKIAAIVGEAPDVRWQVCDSRRTPEDLPEHLPDAPNLSFRHWRGGVHRLSRRVASQNGIRLGDIGQRFDALRVAVRRDTGRRHRTGAEETPQQTCPRHRSAGCRRTGVVDRQRLSARCRRPTVLRPGEPTLRGDHRRPPVDGQGTGTSPASAAGLGLGASLRDAIENAGAFFHLRRICNLPVNIRRARGF